MLSTRLRRALVAPLVLVALASMTGCGSDDVAENRAEDAIEDASGGDADVDIDGDEVEITTSEGTVTMGKGELPDGFPDDIPVIDGEIVSAMGAADQGFVVALTVDDPEAAFEEAVAELEGAGFAEEDGGDMLGATVAQMTRGEQTVILSAGGDGAASMLTYTVALK